MMSSHDDCTDNQDNDVVACWIAASVLPALAAAGGLATVRAALGWSGLGVFELV